MLSRIPIETNQADMDEAVGDMNKPNTTTQRSREWNPFTSRSNPTMSYGRPTVPDSLIRDQILAIYAGIGPDAIRPTRTQLMGSLAVGWERVKLMRDAMAERGEIPTLKPSTSGLPSCRG